MAVTENESKENEQCQNTTFATLGAQENDICNYRTNLENMHKKKHKKHNNPEEGVENSTLQLETGPTHLPNKSKKQKRQVDESVSEKQNYESDASSKRKRKKHKYENNLADEIPSANNALQAETPTKKRKKKQLEGSETCSKENYVQNISTGTLHIYDTYDEGKQTFVVKSEPESMDSFSPSLIKNKLKRPKRINKIKEVRKLPNVFLNIIQVFLVCICSILLWCRKCTKVIRAQIERSSYLLSLSFFSKL